MKLNPFFSYFGSKWRSTRYYPQPLYNLVLEPFAGSAGYSLNFSNLEIRLYDIDTLVCSLWEYLIKVKESEILALPAVVDNVDEHILIQEQKHLIGFWLNKGATYPRKSATRWVSECYGVGAFWDEKIRNRIAQQLKYIRHWRIFNKSYKYVDNRLATWFIDPPYQDLKNHYVKNNLDYNHLGSWCKERYGQTIVCEQQGADWLNFKKLGSIGTTPGRSDDAKSEEVIWYNKNE